MAEAVRMSAQETHGKVQSGKALLVCAYDDDTKFEGLHLEMAIPLSEFLKKLPSLPKDQEIVFYCA